MTKTDYELIEELKLLQAPGKTEDFIKKHVRPEPVAFHEFLQQCISEKNESVAKVMNNSRINKNYGYNIINGIRKRPGRDKVLALCIGAGMDFDQVQHSLALAGQPSLNPRNERDIRIAVAINNRIGDVLKLNLQLEEKNLEPLKV